MQKSRTTNSVTVNRRAHFDYTLGEELTCGMSLSGAEVRLIRDHHVQLKGSFVTLRQGELWLNNLTLGADTERNVKLLVTKKQLASLARARQDGFQLVPVRLLAGGRYIKLVIATGKGKKKYDKRETIKKRDISRSLREQRSYFLPPCKHDFPTYSQVFQTCSQVSQSCPQVFQSCSQVSQTCSQVFQTYSRRIRTY